MKSVRDICNGAAFNLGTMIAAARNGDRNALHFIRQVIRDCAFVAPDDFVLKVADLFEEEMKQELEAIDKASYHE